MDKNLNIFSLWAVDSMDDQSVLKKQMQDFISLGFNGVVFHPRRYSGNIKYLSTEYMDVLSELILFAKNIGLDFWLYDENGWPSGSADGQVIESMPELKCKWLELSSSGNVEIKERQGINSLDKKGVERFVEITHAGYKKGLAKDAFEYVGGFFSDEVGFLEGHGACMDRGGIPWSDEIADKYKLEYNADINDKLAELFDENESNFKIWYWETLTKLLADNFYGVIEKWCADNGKLYTAHLKGEENPFFQIGYSGSCFQVMKNISVPGIDALERYLGNKYYPRIASSLSKQFRNGIAMAEAMGGAGWGLTPKDVFRYTEWLIKNGINFIIFHINQLHLTYDGITDWPSSIPCHQPWREVFPMLIEKMRNEADRQRTGNTLLICPTRGVMNTFAPKLVKGMNEHDGSHQMITKSSQISRHIVDMCNRLYDEDIDFDLTDEKIFEDCGETEENILRIGKCRYKNIVAADGCLFTEKGQNLCKNLNVITLEQLISQKEKNIIISSEKNKAIKQSEWEYTAPEVNRYFVETENGKGSIYTEYLCDCILLVSDMCDKVILNGIPLMSIDSDEYGFRYSVPLELLHIGMNSIELFGTEKAFVYVIGDFAVKNKNPFYEFDSRQLCTRNGFYITKKGTMDNDFILSGYPFSKKPVICEKQLEGSIDGYLKINCKHIAAARVFINGKELGWVYGGNEYVRIDNRYKKVSIKCEVYQSAFNIYGPHHHIEGDRPLISPMQFCGKKNFADAVWLPQYTLEEDMKFLKWEMDKNVEVIERTDA